MEQRSLTSAIGRSKRRKIFSVTQAAAYLVMLTMISVFTGSGRAQSPKSPTTDPIVAGEPMKSVVPVHLDPATGDIKIGRTTYYGASPGMHLLALKRQPDPTQPDMPIFVREGTFLDPGSANLFLATVRNNVPDAIVIANGVGNYNFFVASIAISLQQFGGAIDLEGAPVIPFVFVGNGGQKMGEARQRGGSVLPMDGYLAIDPHVNFRFVQTDYVRYDITTDGTIKVGNTTYDVASSYKPGCGSDGSNSFHLLLLSRETLQLTSPISVNNTYCTAQSDAEIVRLKNDLVAQVGNNEGVLVFLASNGHPIPANWGFGTDGDARFYPLAGTIAQLGGYFETMVYLTPTDTYALVGAVAPPSYVANARQRAKESSSVYPDKPTGELHGVLARGRGNWYSPLNADPTHNGVAERGLYDVLAQTPIPFPNPANAAEQTAYTNINNAFVAANLLCDGCNVRDRYSDLNINIQNYTDLLTSLKNDCGNLQPADQSFCNVRAALLAEFGIVKNIRSFQSNLANLWNAEGTYNLEGLLSTYNSLSSTLPASPTAPAPSLFGPIVNLVLGVASAIPDIGPVFGIADTAFNFGASLTADPQGNAATSLTTTVGQLEKQAQQEFADQATTLGTQFDFIYQDWGKLNALGNNIGKATTGSGWLWMGGTAGIILQSMQANVETSYYSSLMSSIYAIGGYFPDCSVECYNGVVAPTPTLFGQLPLYAQPSAYLVQDPDFGCGAFCYRTAQPFNSSLTFHPAYTYPNDPENTQLPATATILAENQWLGISPKSSPSNGGSAGLYDTPDLSVLLHLFTPRSQGGLGVYRPAFFEGWPFPRVTCGPAHDADGSSGVSGCNWSAAAAAPEALDAPLTSLTVKRNSRAQTGPLPEGEIDVPLTFHNNGSVDIQSMQITNVSLRTLAGSGQAVLLDPALPIQTGGIKPGHSMTTTLRIIVPPGILKLQIGEEGTADNGRLDGLKFSFGHVIFPTQK